MDPILLTKAEAAKRLRLSVRALERHIAGETGPAVTRLGGRVLFQEASLLALIETRTALAPGRAA